MFEKDIDVFVTIDAAKRLVKLLVEKNWTVDGKAIATIKNGSVYESRGGFAKLKISKGGVFDSPFHTDTVELKMIAQNEIEFQKAMTDISDFIATELASNGMVEKKDFITCDEC